MKQWHLEHCWHFYFGRVLVIIRVINVKHYVDNINRKYNVTMAMSPPSVNMAGLCTSLTTFRERRKVNQLHSCCCIRYSLLSRLSYSDGKKVLLLTIMKAQRCITLGVIAQY